MYEHRTAPVLPWPAFARRMLRHGGFVLILALVSIAGGMLGFHFLAMQSWLDAFLNSAMLLGGMGPVGEIKSDEGKVFAGLFALYAGLAFIVAFAALSAPVLHRLLHKLNAEQHAPRR
ncbi:MAG: hypothetical protein ACJ731_02605 [Vicinamibacterales bacterium]